MNVFMRILFMALLLHESCGVIYYLNATEYERMPPLYKLDDYDSCLQKPSDVYCVLNIQLVADEPSELLNIIKEYSEHLSAHFNHTDLRHGVCATKTCQRYILHNNKTSVSRALEGCLNQSFWNDYKLKTRIEHHSCYSLSDNDNNIDIADIVTGVVVLSVVMLNVIGSLYDVYFSKKRDGNNISSPFLLSFSIQRNWKRLISTVHIMDPRLERLKSLNGLRCILAYGVIFVHCLLPYLVAVANPHDLELLYTSLPQHILLNATIMIQVFFVLSGFFLVYKVSINSEKQQLHWTMVPKGIFIRYLRLTPAYALILLLISTWFKFIGPGPLWEVTGKLMISDCHRRWWLNLLYLNNYVYDSQCLLPSWYFKSYFIVYSIALFSNFGISYYFTYLATDMQLFCFGLIVCVLLKNSRFRKTVLTSLFLLGILMAAIHTYVRDLYPIVIIWPSETSLFFKTDPTFNETYKMGHSNVACYVIGMSLGYFVYWWQKKKMDIKKYSNLKYIYWAVCPMIAGVIMSGAIFYRQAEKEPLYVRVLYAAFAKPVIGILIAILIAGMIFKFENVYRKILETNIWTIPSKLTYSVYLVHYVYVIIYLNMQSSLLYFTMFNIVFLTTSIALISFITAVPLYVLVEAPFREVIKLLVEQRSKRARGHQKLQ